MSQRIFVPNMNLKNFHVVELLHNFFVAMVTVVTIATTQASDTFYPKEHMHLIWTQDTLIKLSYCTVCLLPW